QRLSGLDGVERVRRVEQLAERSSLQFRIVRTQVQLREAKHLLLLEQLVEPLARRMQLQPVTGVRRDERPSPTVPLHAQRSPLGAPERSAELPPGEREADVVDTRQIPLSGLDDDVDGAALELGQPQLEAELVELLPAGAGLEGGQVLADAPVPRDELEAE